MDLKTMRERGAPKGALVRVNDPASFYAGRAAIVCEVAELGEARVYTVCLATDPHISFALRAELAEPVEGETFLVCVHAGPELGRFGMYGDARHAAQRRSAHRRVNVYPVVNGETGARLFSFRHGEAWPVDA